MQSSISKISACLLAFTFAHKNRPDRVHPGAGGTPDAVGVERGGADPAHLHGGPAGHGALHRGGRVLRPQVSALPQGPLLAFAGAAGLEPAELHRDPLRGADARQHARHELRLGGLPRGRDGPPALGDGLRARGHGGHHGGRAARPGARERSLSLSSWPFRYFLFSLHFKFCFGTLSSLSFKRFWLHIYVLLHSACTEKPFAFISYV